MMMRVVKIFLTASVVVLVVAIGIATFKKINTVALESSAKKSISKLEAASQEAASFNSDNKTKESKKEDKGIKLTFFGEWKCIKTK